MPDFKIISDSSCDMSPELVKKYDVHVVPFEVTLDDGKTYLKEFTDITPLDFHKQLRANPNITPKTSLPSIQAYSDAFRPYLEAGRDVFCVNITSKFSGSHQSAQNAASLLREDFPNRQIVVYNTGLCTASQCALITEIDRMRKAGLELDEIIGKCDKMRVISRIYVTVDTLHYLQKGGRIGKVSALAGSLLNIKPIIMFKDGELMPLSKVRGRKKALEEIILQLNSAMPENKDDCFAYVMHADEPADAMEVAAVMREQYGMKLPFPLLDLGVTIGAHIGPTTVAIGFMNKYETV